MFGLIKIGDKRMKNLKDTVRFDIVVSFDAENRKDVYCEVYDKVSKELHATENHEKPRMWA